MTPGLLYLECGCGLRFPVGQRYEPFDDDAALTTEDLEHLERHARTEDRVVIVEQMGVAGP